MIAFNNVTEIWKRIEDKTLPKLTEFLRNGPYILGEQVEKFEQEFAEFCGIKYAVGVSNGTDALKLAIQALQPDENTKVLIAANSHISNALAPAYFDLPITLIDCDQNYGIDVDAIENYVDTALGADENIIVIATHLYGNPVDVERIKRILPQNSYLIEDCSQAHGLRIGKKHVGTIGDIGVFSLYPTKNLGAAGDAGIIITKDYSLFEMLKSLRNYGSFDKKNCVHLGWNNRLDDIQALILREKLSFLDLLTTNRRQIADMYTEQLKGVGDIILPPTEGVNHLFPIRTTRRGLLKSFLEKRKIPTLIHYQTPIQQTDVFNHLSSHRTTNQLGRCPRTVRYSEEILSLPMHPYLTNEEVNHITATIKHFYEPLSCIECGGHIELMEATEGYVCRWCIRKATDFKSDIINPTGKFRDSLID